MPTPPSPHAVENSGHRTSDFKFVVKESRGAGITGRSEPGLDDLLRPRAEALCIHCDAVGNLFHHICAERLGIASVADDRCVPDTGVDARMRDLAVVVPSGCIAVRNRRSLEHLRDDPSVKMSPARTVKLSAGAKS